MPSEEEGEKGRAKGKKKKRKDEETTDVNEEPAGPECAAWGASHEGKN